MSDHKEMDKKSKCQRGLSRRAQLRQQQKAIETLNLKLRDYLNAIHIHYHQAVDYKKMYEEAITLTPQEKAELAHQQMRRMQHLNAEMCKIGVCIHKECQKKQ
jgi:hypothetical protein